MELDNKTKKILNDFYNISGIRVSIHDTSFNEVFSYPYDLSPFCKCVQSLPELRKECLMSDAYAFEVVNKTNKLYVYRCNFGLYEAVAPIYNYGRLAGYLMLGQIKDSDSLLLDKTIKYLKENGVEASEINRAKGKIVSLGIEKLYSYINIMTVVAEHFTATNTIKKSQENLPFLIHKEIISNYKKDLSLSSLAKKFGCSITTITNCYKKEYDTSVRTAIINARLSHASELLKNTTKSIKEISEECGFYDQNHFYRTFKKEYNLSPSEYREQKN